MDCAKSMIASYVGKKNVVFTKRGNSAILHALRYAKSNSKFTDVLIPDMGGWLTYPVDSKEVGLNAVTVKTLDGLFDMDDLREKSSIACAVIYANPAGYFAHHDIERIYDICSGNKCKVIMDVPGCIGDPELCNGNYADIMVGSFGRWKVIDNGDGGFIATDNELSIEDEFTINEKLLKKIEEAPKRIEWLYSLIDEIKKDLRDFDIIYPNHKGINVVIAYSSKEEKEKIMNYCSEKDYRYVECPFFPKKKEYPELKYPIRVLRNAISIEVKKLSGCCLSSSKNP